MPVGSKIGGALVVALAMGAIAHADPAPAPATTAAAALFDRGRQYVAAGKYAEACAAFEQSQRLDPQLGTLFNLAGCNARIGRLATAWSQFRDLAQRDPNKPRRAKAAQQADALVARVPRLLIKLEPAVADASVTSNGIAVDALLGVETPVDLGDYAIVARAPGYAESRTTASVTEEAKTVVVSVALHRPIAEPIAPPVAPVVAPAALPSPAGEPPGRPMLAIVALGGGGALIAGGVVFGVLASQRWDDAKAACGGGSACPSVAALSHAQNLTSRARAFGDISTGLVVAGALAVGAGTYLWLRAPASSSAVTARLAPDVNPTGAGLVVDGRF